MGLDTLGPHKCATCPSRSAPPALWMQTDSGYMQCWASADWFSVHCCRSCLRSMKTLTAPSSNLLSSLCLYVLSPGNWETWCCSPGLPRSRGTKSSGCNRIGTQFSLLCTQPWRLSAGLLRWSRCIESKLLLSSSLLLPRTRLRRTSTLFRYHCLHSNWLQAVWVGQECSYWGSWRGLRLHLKCTGREFRWGQVAWVWK